MEMKSVGCMNLGNTCYLNSVVQCVVNSHYFKDYFLHALLLGKKDIIMSNEQFAHLRVMFSAQRDLEWAKQVNISNPMAFEGQIVKSFASLIEDLFTSSMMCILGPKRFKR